MVVDEGFHHELTGGEGGTAVVYQGKSSDERLRKRGTITRNFDAFPGVSGENLQRAGQGSIEIENHRYSRCVVENI